MARSLDPEQQLALVRRLSDGQWHRGEDMAAPFGISRAAIAARVQHLLDWGLQVETHRGRGYRLAQAITMLDAAAIQAAAELPPETLAITVRDWVDSTNAQLAVADPMQDPQVMLAEGQSAGRGRRARAWQSPVAQNLYLSLAWTFEQWPPRLQTLSLAVGVVLWRLLRELGVDEACIKWPNDLWLHGRKLAGILIEHRGEVGGSCRVVVGVGLNLAPWREQGSDSALQAIGVADALGAAMPDRNQIAGRLLRLLHEGLAQFAASSFDSFTADYRRADLLSGSPVRVQNGERWTDGTATGISADGGLLLKTSQGLQEFHAGDVSVRPA